ncbi:kinase-like protein [Teratosphaeria nubilosa]|uniref:Kinase-like protein n=1 Tax=Teratosphaeria nubilosa TaxID=161662 RepID=A0A6G1LDT2_9PEZI|nr:kinase-like protein [Teratosphaeria nubilosa]
MSKTTAQPIEEQKLPRYRQRHYCPICIGQRLIDRYKMIAKLGFGAYSTVWMARDESANTYASIKVFVQDERADSPVTNELNVLRKLKECPSDHFAASGARLPSEFFQVEGPSGRHHCIASEPKGCSLWDLQDVFPGRRMPHQLVANIVRGLLGCINWLYLDCDLTHTEITSQNVLADLSNDEPFAMIEREEAAEPSVPIMDGDYPVYHFGSARTASVAQTDWCMPDTYRAPEVLLCVPWGCQIDVWSIGMMALQLIEARNLFNPIDYAHSQYVLPVAVAQYISVLGSPPMWMIQESRNPDIRALFDDQGRWTSEVPIPKFSLEDWVTAIPDGQDKEDFLRFIRRVLVWEGLERGTSTDLFAEEWTTSGLR